jgi:DNA-binding CsgD family transcriptional regulator
MIEISLTEKELQTVGLLAHGRRRSDVAREMGVSMNTVKARINTLLYKTHARNTVQMVHVLTKRGLLALIFTISLSADIDDDKHRRHTRRRVRPVPVMVRGQV